MIKTRTNIKNLNLQTEEHSKTNKNTFFIAFWEIFQQLCKDFCNSYADVVQKKIAINQNLNKCEIVWSQQLAPKTDDDDDDDI